MSTNNQISRILTRLDGSQAKIVATAFYSPIRARSFGVSVYRRNTPGDAWHLTSDRPHPDWRTMSVDEYIKRGRSEMLQTVSHGEIFKVTNELAAMSPA